MIGWMKQVARPCVRAIRIRRGGELAPGTNAEGAGDLQDTLWAATTIDDDGHGW